MNNEHGSDRPFRKGGKGFNNGFGKGGKKFGKPGGKRFGKPGGQKFSHGGPRKYGPGSTQEQGGEDAAAGAEGTVPHGGDRKPVPGKFLGPAAQQKRTFGAGKKFGGKKFASGGAKKFGTAGKTFGPGGKSSFFKGKRSEGAGAGGTFDKRKQHGDKPKLVLGPPVKRPGRAQTPESTNPEFATSWEHVAQWYDRMVGDEGSDYHRHVLLPSTLRLLDPQPGQKVLDLCCGQGVLSRLLAERVGEVVGVDMSPSLIDAARERTSSANVRYEVADARNLGAVADGSFDSAACVMAVHDVNDLPALLTGMAGSLKAGGHAVLVLMHPCFRIPRQSSWGWDEQHKTQYRRVDRYISALDIPISTHPGADPGEHTFFFHRPLSTYLNALGSVGLAVTACEELVGHRESEPGPRSRAENRARREVPIFIALRAVKLA